MAKCEVPLCAQAAEYFINTEQKMDGSHQHSWCHSHAQSKGGLRLGPETNRMEDSPDTKRKLEESFVKKRQKKED